MRPTSRIPNPTTRPNPIALPGCNLQDELFASFEQVLALGDKRGEPYARIVLENSGVAEPHVSAGWEWGLGVVMVVCCFGWLRSCSSCVQLFSCHRHCRLNDRCCNTADCTHCPTPTNQPTNPNQPPVHQSIRDNFAEAAAAGHPLMKRIYLDTLVTVVDSSTFIQDYASR